MATHAPKKTVNIKPTVLVAGATGYFGSHIVKELVKQGYKVKALVRTEAQLKDLEALGCSTLIGTFANQNTLKQVAAGCEVIISCLGFRWKEASGLSTADDLYKLLADGNKLLHKEGVKAGSKQLILLSHYLNKPHKHDFLEFDAREEAIDFLVEQNEKHPPLETPHYTVLEYNFTFRDIEQDIVRIQKDGANAEWLAVGKGAMEYRLNPISASDLAKHTVSAVLNPAFYDRRVPVGGPEAYTWLQIASACFKSVGEQPVYKVVSFFVYTIWWYILGFLAMFGRPGLEVQVDQMGKQRLRYCDDTLAPPYGSDDLLAHIAAFGKQLRERNEREGNRKKLGDKKTD